MAISRRFSGATTLIREKGVCAFLRACAQNISWEFQALTRRHFWRPPTFRFQGRPYQQFWHKHTVTWTNERSVEIPIAWDLVRSCRGSVLEIGNVLSHYFPIAHDVVDKYEKAPGVINEDIVHFDPGREYDLIVSISTIEHIGFDYDYHDETKPLRATKRMRELLSPSGMAVVTFPLGYNPYLDSMLSHGKLGFSRCAFLRRVAAEDWAEAEYREVRHSKFDRPFNGANGLVVGFAGSFPRQ